MQGIKYLDVPQAENEERLICPSTGVSAEGLMTLGSIYELSQQMDEIDGFKDTPLKDLRDYLTRIEGPFSQFQTPNRDIVNGARMALQLGAFEDARQGLIWPLQDKAPFQTYYSHPWEHRPPWDERGKTQYPAIRPTGVTLDYKAGAQRTSRPLQRVFYVGMEGLRYKTEEVSKQSLAAGLRVVADTFRIVRGTNQEVLDYYFENRHGIRDLVREHFDAQHPWNSWKARLALNKKLQDELDQRGPLYERFAFQQPGGLFINLGSMREADEAGAYLEELDRGGVPQIFSALLYFAAIDLSLSEDVPEIEQGSPFNMPSTDADRTHFKKCYDDYGAYLRRAYAAQEGFAYPYHGPRMLFENEIYALLTYLILFKSHDLMNPKEYNPHGTACHYEGQRYIYVEDLAERMVTLGIDFRYLETLVVELNQYFRSLGLMLVRRSGQRSVDAQLVNTWERLNGFFRHNPVFAQRDLLQARLLSEIPFR